MLSFVEAPTLFPILQKRCLACREHGNLQIKLPTMVHGQAFYIINLQHPHQEGSIYLQHKDVMGSSVGLSTGNLYQYPAVTGSVYTLIFYHMPPFLSFKFLII
jgi:hypothetical protein